MNYSLTPDKVQSMGKSMETHRCQKEKPVSLADQLKGRKTMMGKQQKYHDQNMNYSNQNYQQNPNINQNCMNMQQSNMNNGYPMQQMNNNGFY